MDKHIELAEEITRIKNQLVDLMLSRLQRDKGKSKHVLLGTFEQILQSVDSPVALAVFIDAIEKNECSALVDVDTIKDFMVFVSKVYADEDAETQKLWDEFNEESCKLMKKRLEEIKNGNHPDEEEEEVDGEERSKIKVLLEELTNLIDEGTKDD